MTRRMPRHPRMTRRAPGHPAAEASSASPSRCWPSSPPPRLPPRPASKESELRKAIAALPEEYRRWLEEVDAPAHRRRARGVPHAREGLPARRLHRALLAGARPVPGHGAQRAARELGGARGGSAPALHRSRRRADALLPAERPAGAARGRHLRHPALADSRSGSTTAPSGCSEIMVLVFSQRSALGQVPSLAAPSDGLAMLFQARGADRHASMSPPREPGSRLRARRKHRRAPSPRCCGAAPSNTRR